MLVNYDVSIRSTFFVLGGGVQYSSLWRNRLKSKFASSSSLPYSVLKQYWYENWSHGTYPECCSTCDFRAGRYSKLKLTCSAVPSNWCWDSSYSVLQDYTFKVSEYKTILL